MNALLSKVSESSVLATGYDFSTRIMIQNMKKSWNMKNHLRMDMKVILSWSVLILIYWTMEKAKSHSKEKTSIHQTLLLYYLNIIYLKKSKATCLF